MCVAIRRGCVAISTAEQERQIRQAEELLFSGAERPSFAKGLYFGQFLAQRLLPYPTPEREGSPEVDRAVEEVQRFAEEHIDPAEIDRQADIPREVIDGLGRLGVLGMAVPREYGGLGFSQHAYCRVLEVIGARCASTAVFVNAHHSIGVRALVLFGTPEQKARWLAPLARGEQLAAFALTEPEAGSDAANVQTMARPSPDGSHYILNGEKRYITNGAIADVFTVMACTPVPASDETQVTAFLVTRDLPGFEITEARMEKCGIRGTATSRLAFRDVPVPADRILGGLGTGLRVALTVLDFGCTTFGATCTGAAKVCLRAAAEHANTRHQFGRPLGGFELIKKKLAWIAAHTYAMEATTYQTAALIDRGQSDYMLETAILKVFATEALWRIVNETIQVFGGQAYFSREPYERMMRDARINLIGEGANEVLLAFIALVGMRGVGEQLKDVKEAWDQLGGALKSFQLPRRQWQVLRRFTASRLRRSFELPDVPVTSPQLADEAGRLSRQLRKFAAAVEAVLRHWRAEILERQYVQERIARAAIALYTSSCVLARLDDWLARAEQRQGRTNGLVIARTDQEAAATDLGVARHYLSLARREFATQLAHLWDPDDAATTQVADSVLHWHRL
ncbi:MAG: acyl-CoA dehydrogenase family protein [Planctomycetes bacterium]|nr:acyl-CoA dehydrogenase family protein [Planctomycetota bacterium]